MEGIHCPPIGKGHLHFSAAPRRRQTCLADPTRLGFQQMKTGFQKPSLGFLTENNLISYPKPGFANQKTGFQTENVRFRRRIGSWTPVQTKRSADKLLETEWETTKPDRRKPENQLANQLENHRKHCKTNKA